MKLSIIVPVFNEEKTINQVLKKIKFINLQKITKEIIVIDDASNDQTPKILNTWKKKSIIFIKHQFNRGKGAAIKSGLSIASGELVLIQDADLEYDPIFYKDLLRPFINEKAEVVYGTRLTNYPLKLWGREKTVLPSHLLANKFLTFLTNLLYESKLTDMETGYKVFKRQVLERIKINSQKFDFEAEITAKILKMGIKIVEIPIETKPRTYQEGKKISWQDGVGAIWSLVKYRFMD